MLFVFAYLDTFHAYFIYYIFHAYLHEYFELFMLQIIRSLRITKRYLYYFNDYVGTLSMKDCLAEIMR